MPIPQTALLRVKTCSVLPQLDAVSALPPPPPSDHASVSSKTSAIQASNAPGKLAPKGVEVAVLGRVLDCLCVLRESGLLKPNMCGLTIDEQQRYGEGMPEAMEELAEVGKSCSFNICLSNTLTFAPFPQQKIPQVLRSASSELLDLLVRLPVDVLPTVLPHLISFLRSHLLVWIEILALTHTLARFVHRIPALIQTLKQLDATKPQLTDARVLITVLGHAWRMVRRFYGPVSRSWVQLYRTAVPFSPVLASQLSGFFEPGLTGLASPAHVALGRQRDWGGLLSVWEDREMGMEGAEPVCRRAGFFCGGAVIVSLVGGQRLRFRDTMTGELLAEWSLGSANLGGKETPADPSCSIVAFAVHSNGRHLAWATSQDSTPACDDSPSLAKSLTHAACRMYVAEVDSIGSLALNNTAPSNLIHIDFDASDLVAEGTVKPPETWVVEFNDDGTVLAVAAATARKVMTWFYSIGLNGNFAILLSSLSLEGDFVSLRFVRSTSAVKVFLKDARIVSIDPTLGIATSLEQLNSAPPAISKAATNGEIFVCGTKDGAVYMWRNALTKPQLMGNFGFQIESLCITPDAKYFAAGDCTGSFSVYEIETGMKVDMKRALSSAIRSINIARPCPQRGYEILTGSADGFLILWDAAELIGDRDSPITSKRLVGHSGAVTCMSFAKISGFLILATGSEDQTVRIWDPESAIEFFSTSPLSQIPRTLDFALGGTHVRIGLDAALSQAAPPDSATPNTFRLVEWNWRSGKPPSAVREGSIRLKNHGAKDAGAQDPAPGSHPISLDVDKEKGWVQARASRSRQNGCAMTWVDPRWRRPTASFVMSVSEKTTLPFPPPFLIPSSHAAEPKRFASMTVLALGNAEGKIMVVVVPFGEDEEACVLRTLSSGEGEAKPVSLRRHDPKEKVGGPGSVPEEASLPMASKKEKDSMRRCRPPPLAALAPPTRWGAKAIATAASAVASCCRTGSSEKTPEYQALHPQGEEEMDTEGLWRLEDHERRCPGMDKDDKRHFKEETKDEQDFSGNLEYRTTSSTQKTASTSSSWWLPSTSPSTTKSFTCDPDSDTVDWLLIAAFVGFGITILMLIVGGCVVMAEIYRSGQGTQVDHSRSLQDVVKIVLEKTP
ncbi:Echinoderm microtubule-associated protein-like 6 [Phlyctochytrium bullatum]|nr:Echinoderm microtubule-associated protein-like 6 [Phlyctochytrium bullatum]